jgi:hypothetical protein
VAYVIEELRGARSTERWSSGVQHWTHTPDADLSPSRAVLGNTRFLLVRFMGLQNGNLGYIVVVPGNQNGNPGLRPPIALVATCGRGAGREQDSHR